MGLGWRSGRGKAAQTCPAASSLRLPAALNQHTNPFNLTHTHTCTLLTRLTLGAILQKKYRERGGGGEEEQQRHHRQPAKWQHYLSQSNADDVLLAA